MNNDFILTTIAYQLYVKAEKVNNLFAILIAAAAINGIKKRNRQQGHIEKEYVSAKVLQGLTTISHAKA